MASQAGSARSGGRGRALVLALLACVLVVAGLVVYVAILSRDAPHHRPPSSDRTVGDASAASTPYGPDGIPESAESAAIQRESVRTSERDPQGPWIGPILVGRVVDELGAPLRDTRPLVAVEGPLGQRLVVPVDGHGGIGPMRLLPGRWIVFGEAPGRRPARREVELSADGPAQPFALVLARVGELEVQLRNTGREGNDAAELDGIARLLVLQSRFGSDGPLQRHSFTPRSLGAGRGRSWRASLRPEADRPGLLVLYLGSQPVLQRDVAAGLREISLELDLEELGRRLIALELELRDARGAPLEGITQVLLSWGADVHLVAGQPGHEPWRASFAECPPGPASLLVVDVDGRRAEAELFVPHEGPARLEVGLEFAAPAHE